MRVEPEVLLKLLDKASFASSGDGYEQQFGSLVTESFSNSERFWRLFVVPLTQRMEGYPDRLIGEVKFRPSVSPELEDIAAMHYSAFRTLIDAHVHLQVTGFSWVADFYVHLGSACDLVEMVLERWYLLLLKCRGEQTEVLQQLSRWRFLRMAWQWYDERYPALYEYYLSKGKSPPLRLPSRRNILEEYLGRSEVWKEYKRHSQSLREFRNVIVHDVEVGRVVINGEVFIPRPRVIQRYRTWREVFAAVGDPDKIRRDFVQPAPQAKDDLAKLETILNQLWEEPLIADFEEEFYSPERTALREMYVMEFENT